MATTMAQITNGRLKIDPRGYSHTKNRAMAQTEIEIEIIEVLFDIQHI